MSLEGVRIIIRADISNEGSYGALFTSTFVAKRGDEGVIIREFPGGQKFEVQLDGDPGTLFLEAGEFFLGLKKEETEEPPTPTEKYYFLTLMTHKRSGEFETHNQVIKGSPLAFIKGLNKSGYIAKYMTYKTITIINTLEIDEEEYEEYKEYFQK